MGEKNRKRSAIGAVIFAVVFGCFLAARAGFAQQIPNATINGVRSLQWFVGSTAAYSYSDAGFQYPSLGGQGSPGQGPQGYYYTITDAGSPAFTTSAVFCCTGLSQLSIDVVLPAGATGTLQAQESNDGIYWSNVGTLLTPDGGSQTMTFGGVGTQSVISPCSAGAARVEYFSTSVSNVQATAFVH
jgi:hypothetical protein